MRLSLSIIAVSTSAIFLQCNQSTPVETIPETNLESSVKKPLIFDENQILYPPANHPSDAGLSKTASTYYSFWKFNTFGYPATIQPTDCNVQMASDNQYGCGINYPWVDHMEATYSSRLSASPELLWQPVYSTWPNYLQSGTLLDNEQVESHLYPNRICDNRGCANIEVNLDFEVSSEQGWDFLWVTSTSSDGTCNSPGVVRKKISGEANGHVSFSIPGNCPSPWIGVYYIKDGSISRGGDYARIKSVSMTPYYP